MEGRGIDETAAETGWSKTMVKVQAFRARQKLKSLCARLGVSDIQSALELDSVPDGGRSNE
jgi:DNA-directed RNA polymerase specialized sigma24 family protein